MRWRARTRRPTAVSVPSMRNANERALREIIQEWNGAHDSRAMDKTTKFDVPASPIMNAQRRSRSKNPTPRSGACRSRWTGRGKLVYSRTTGDVRPSPSTTTYLYSCKKRRKRSRGPTNCPRHQAGGAACGSSGVTICPGLASGDDPRRRPRDVLSRAAFRPGPPPVLTVSMERYPTELHHGESVKLRE